MGLLTLVRHGQASFLQADYDKLSALGEAQAAKLAEYWIERGVRFDHVYYGPARRQSGTGEIVRRAYVEAGLEWPEPVSVPEFDEYPGIEVMRAFLPGLIDKHEDIRVLEAEFRTAGEHTVAARAFEKMFQRVTRMWVAGDLESPEAETWQAFCDRVERGIARVREAGGSAAIFKSLTKSRYSSCPGSGSGERAQRQSMHRRHHESRKVVFEEDSPLPRDAEFRSPARSAPAAHADRRPAPDSPHRVQRPRTDWQARVP